MEPSPTHELTRIFDWIRWGASRFSEAGLVYGHGTDNAWDEAAYLVLHAVHLPPDANPLALHALLTVAEREQVLDLLLQRIRSRKPAPYLTHEAWFAGFALYVDERVLVPRSPFAELIENGFEPWLENRPITRILDLCTGSGCIAIACALAFPEAHVDAADLSPAALEVARLNVARHAVEERVRLVESDLFEALAGRSYDLILSNPPYVPEAERERLAAEFLHEPDMGLVAGKTGLEVVERVLQEGPAHLAPGGMMAVEVGQGRAMLEARHPQLPFVWPAFARGGEGVFLLNAEDFTGPWHP